jgi:Methyltransferase domain
VRHLAAIDADIGAHGKYVVLQDQVMTDWPAWHSNYDDNHSSLSRRLMVVRQRLDQLVAGDPRVRRILSLCSGDGRDILPVLAQQPHAQRAEVVLVELDPALSAAAKRRAVEAGVVANVVVGDAGLLKTWQSFLPVDLLMLCGIFGNISEADIRSTVDAARATVSRGGHVIWTRGYFDDQDLRPQIRAWFIDAGFAEISFDSEPTGYGIGVNRQTSDADAAPLPDRLFSFVR